MSSRDQGYGERYRVRWLRAAGDREQLVEYAHYSQAEACFISLFSVIERPRGGWAGLWDGERCVVQVGQSDIEDSEEEDENDEEEGDSGRKVERPAAAVLA